MLWRITCQEPLVSLKKLTKSILLFSVMDEPWLVHSEPLINSQILFFMELLNESMSMVISVIFHVEFSSSEVIFNNNNIFLIHFVGENVALFGEVDLENENKGNLTEVSIEEILELHQRETSLKDNIERRKTRAMRERGLIPHTDVPDDLYFWISISSFTVNHIFTTLVKFALCYFFSVKILTPESQIWIYTNN